MVVSGFKVEEEGREPRQDVIGGVDGRKGKINDIRI